jgi:hypothetical protein
MLTIINLPFAIAAMSQQKPPKSNNPLNSYAKYSGIAIQMVVIIGLGTYGGLKLDEAYPNKYQVFTLILSLTSVMIAMYVAIRLGSKGSAGQKTENE